MTMVTVTGSINAVPVCDFLLPEECECDIDRILLDVSPDGRLAFFARGPKVIVLDLFYGTQKICVCRSVARADCLHGMLAFSHSDGIALTNADGMWSLSHFLFNGAFVDFSEPLTRSDHMNAVMKPALVRLDRENFGILSDQDRIALTMDIFSYATMKKWKTVQIPLDRDDSLQHIRSVALHNGFLYYICRRRSYSVNLDNGEPTLISRYLGQLDPFVDIYHHYRGPGYLIAKNQQDAILATFCRKSAKYLFYNVRSGSNVGTAFTKDTVVLCHEEGATLLNDSKIFRINAPMSRPQSLADAAFVTARSAKLNLDGLPPVCEFRPLFADLPQPTEANKLKCSNLALDFETITITKMLKKQENNVERTVRIFVAATCPRRWCFWCIMDKVFTRGPPLRFDEADVRRRCYCIRNQEAQKQMTKLVSFQSLTDS